MASARDESKKAWRYVHLLHASRLPVLQSLTPSPLSSEATKMRKNLTKQIEKLRVSTVQGTDISQFDMVDNALGQ